MKKNLVAIYVISMALLLIAILGGTVYAFTRHDDNSGKTVKGVGSNDAESNTTPKTATDTQTNTTTMDANTTPTFKELIKEDAIIGTGKEAKSGDKISVNYTGKLLDGTVFDSSLASGRTPFEFTLGAGMVIEGWDKGFDGMKEGGKRTLKIPASMGYGAQGAGGLIKPNSDLIFEVELLKVN